MEELSATKYGKPSAVIAGTEASRQSKFPVFNDLSLATEVEMALLKDYGIVKSSNDGLLVMPGTTSRDHERATVSVRARYRRSIDSKVSTTPLKWSRRESRPRPQQFI